MNDSKKQLSMDHVQYEGTAPGSIFGPGEKIINDFISKELPTGSWINLGAGDGRYTGDFLRTCDHVTAFDIDPRALAKLDRDLDSSLKAKLVLKLGDLTESLPFENESFDGAFSSATIHIFEESTIVGIVQEMFRIVRTGGMVVTDFLFDIRREMADGELYLYPGEISYSRADAERIIERSFQGQKFELVETEVIDDIETDNGEVKYFFRSGIFLVKGIA